MEQSELNQIVDLHAKWVSGIGGERAKLNGADLRGANLYGVNLRCADLRGADLRGADLRGANLYGAVLSDADLNYANLYGAYLQGATLNWNSHDLIAEILSTAAGDDISKRSLAGLILVSRDWCHDQWSSLKHPERAWACGVLRGYVKDGDDAPAYLCGKRNVDDDKLKSIELQIQ